MPMIFRRLLAFTFACCFASAQPASSQSASGEGSLEQEAVRIHNGAIVIDTHADTTHKLLAPTWDFSVRAATNHVDLPRMREGGLDAVFLSVWTDESEYDGTTVQTALDQIYAIRALTEGMPNDLMLATTAADIRRSAQEGKKAILIGVEGGYMIEDDLRVLRRFFDLGVRYMTLTHQFHTHWADSSGTLSPLKPLHGGLTPFGKQVVREMNRLGIIVDVSHVSDATFWDALEVSRAPLLASHSACRALVDVPRNMSDEMIRELAEKGGVVQILFMPLWINPKKANPREYFSAELEEIGRKFKDEPARAQSERSKLLKEARGAPTTVSHVVDHIEHVIHLVGDNHVGIGGDWDNFSAASPAARSIARAMNIKDTTDGLEDVSKLPSLTLELLRRGFSESTIKKVLGGNTLRLMEEVEDAAEEM